MRWSGVQREFGDGLARSLTEESDYSMSAINAKHLSLRSGGCGPPRSAANSGRQRLKTGLGAVLGPAEPDLALSTFSSH